MGAHVSNRTQPSALDRRDFVKLGGLGAAALAAGGATACSAPEAATGDDRGPEWWTELSFELEEVGIAELQEGMASGRWSAEEITR